MIKFFLPTLLFFVTLSLPFDIFASSLDVSKSPIFSGSDVNFAGGETVYVRVKTDKVGSSSVLSIRDNNYSSINTINLNRSGDSYTANFSAPTTEGYYSLEAKIEGDGINVTSVKTIKVGNPTSADINVNVNSSVKGSRSEQKTVISSNSEKSDVDNSQDVNESVEVFSANSDVDMEKDDADGQGFFGMIFGVLEGAWNLIRFF